jgi:hypothetical protein
MGRFVLFSLLGLLSCVVHSRTVMPWFCLDVCSSKAEIEADIQQLRANHSYFTAISYEAYALRDKATFHYLNITNITSLLAGKLH